MVPMKYAGGCFYRKVIAFSTIKKKITRTLHYMFFQHVQNTCNIFTFPSNTQSRSSLTPQHYFSVLILGDTTWSWIQHVLCPCWKL